MSAAPETRPGEHLAEPAGPTVRQARDRYFAENDLGDGGYDDAWVRLRAGPISIGFPNSAARVAAVRLHDVHHVLTGYGTTWTGEAEIGAWEIAGGCGHHLVAWILNLQALAIGLVIAPRRVYAAFVRGRRESNLYATTLGDDLLDLPLGALRQRLADSRTATTPTAGDRLAFAGWALLALATFAATATAATLPPAWLAVRLASLFRG